MTEYADVPADVLARLQRVCLELPEAYGQPAWAGTRWYAAPVLLRWLGA